MFCRPSPRARQFSATELRPHSPEDRRANATENTVLRAFNGPHQRGHSSTERRISRWRPNADGYAPRDRRPPSDLAGWLNNGMATRLALARLGREPTCRPPSREPAVTYPGQPTQQEFAIGSGLPPTTARRPSATCRLRGALPAPSAGHRRPRPTTRLWLLSATHDHVRRLPVPPEARHGQYMAK